MGVGLDAGIVNILGAGGANFVGGDAVFGWINEVVDSKPEAIEGVGFEAAFEDGVLDAESVVFAVFGDAGEALGVGDVVGDEGEHLAGSAAVASGLGFGKGEGEGGFPPAFGRGYGGEG